MMELPDREMSDIFGRFEPHTIMSVIDRRTDGHQPTAGTALKHGVASRGEHVSSFTQHYVECHFVQCGHQIRPQYFSRLGAAVGKLTCTVITNIKICWQTVTQLRKWKRKIVKEMKENGREENGLQPDKI